TRTFLKDAVFLPEYFKQQGYVTLKVGKIFHTGDEFEDPRSWDEDVRETKEAKNPPEGQILRKQGKGGVVLPPTDEETYHADGGRRAAGGRGETAARAAGVFPGAVPSRRPPPPNRGGEKLRPLSPPKDVPLREEPAEHLKNIPPVALTYEAGAKPMPEQQRRE